MRKSVLTILATIISCALSAQELKVVSFELDVQDLEAKLNPVIDGDGEAAALLRIISPEEGMAFDGPLAGVPEFVGDGWLVYLSRGAESLTMKVRGIPSLTYRFKEDIESSYVYVMHVEALRPERFEAIVVPGISWHPSHTSYSLMVGAMKRFGGYVKVKSDFNGVPEYSDVCNREGWLSDGTQGWFTGGYVKSRSSITAGALAHIKGPFTAYAGIGYGIRTLLWENYDQSYTKVLPSSVKGVEAEAGLMFKAGRLILTAGVSETGFKWMEGSFGIGLRF